jgi:hypothetical protein
MPELQELSVANLESALANLGQLLQERGFDYEVVAIGGGGLLLLGLLVRSTKDLDLVALIDKGEFIPANPLPNPLVQAIQDIAEALNLRKDWVNTGPSDLFTAGLPEGFRGRMDIRRYGGLTIHLAGRFDQICFKLYASVDHGHNSKHFGDLKSLQPTEAELEEAKRWCITHDVSEGFSCELDTTVNELKR